MATNVAHLNLYVSPELRAALEQSAAANDRSLSAEVRVALRAYTSIAAGERTIELRNADYREREFFLVALEPGTDIDDLDQFFEQGEKGLPPAQFHGAMQPIPAGTSVFIDIDLEAGVEYTLNDNTGDQPVVATFYAGVGTF